MAKQHTHTGRIAQEPADERSWGILGRIWAWLSFRVWFVPPQLSLIVNANPALCMQLLGTSAKPSVRRLGYSSLFADGRRYYFQMRRGGGFRMVTDNIVSWHHKRRTKAAAVITGDFERISEGGTRLSLRGRIRIGYLLDIFWLPAFMSSIIIYMPWSRLVIIGLIVTFFALSWIAHRANTALEVNAMLHFVERVLRDHIADAPPALAAQNTTQVVYDARDFTEAWESFYREHVTPND